MSASLNRDEVCDAFREQGLNRLYFFSYITTMETIVQYGLHSLNNMKDTGLKYTSFANPEVQARREAQEFTTSAHETRAGHDMVPFYFTTKTPTLSAVREHQNQFVFWTLPVDCIKDEGIEFAFTDGNLGSNNTLVYFHQADVKNVPFDVIKAPYWPDLPDGSRKRNAEMLIHGNVPIDYIDKVICRTQNTASSFLERLRRRPLSQFSGDVIVKPEAFF